MNNPFTDLVLLILGIALIIFCAASFIFPFGTRFKGQIQKIKIGSANLEISLLTLFFLAGLALSSIGIFLYVRDYESRLDHAKTACMDAQEKLAKANLRTAKMIVDLEGIADSTAPGLNDIVCVYYVPGEDQPVTALVSPGMSFPAYKITLENITAATHIKRLVFADQLTGRSWILEDFMPFEPTFKLKSGS